MKKLFFRLILFCGFFLFTLSCAADYSIFRGENTSTTLDAWVAWNPRVTISDSNTPEPDMTATITGHNWGKVSLSVTSAPSISPGVKKISIDTPLGVVSKYIYVTAIKRNIDFTLIGSGISGEYHYIQLNDIPLDYPELHLRLTPTLGCQYPLDNWEVEPYNNSHDLRGTSRLLAITATHNLDSCSFDLTDYGPEDTDFNGGGGIGLTVMGLQVSFTKIEIPEFRLIAPNSSSSSNLSVVAGRTGNAPALLWERAFNANAYKVTYWKEGSVRQQKSEVFKDRVLMNPSPIRRVMRMRVELSEVLALGSYTWHVQALYYQPSSYMQVPLIISDPSHDQTFTITQRQFKKR